MSKYEQNGQSNEWYTPKYIFDALDTKFNMDVAAPKDRSLIHVPAVDFIDCNSLSKEWRGYIWMNPPFGGRNGIRPWLNKFFAHYNGIALTPDRTSAPWWQEACNKAEGVFFIDGKVKFIKPDGTVGESPSTGTTLFGCGPFAMRALETARNRGLGIFLKHAPIRHF